MPNWCSNTLKVESDNIEKLNDFKEKIIYYKEDDTEKKWPSLTFNKLVPCPEELLNEAAFGAGDNRDELVAKYGASDWYQWRVENWGTKWDAADADTIDDEPDYLTVYFDTAWAPPVPWLLKVAEMYPELRFRLEYEEPGCNFCGYYSVVDGNDIDFEEGELEMVDPGTERLVDYDSTTERWFFVDDKEVVSDDPDYWPDSINPYIQ